MTIKTKLAACVVIPTGSSPEEILAISRRNNHSQWGMPGGKQDNGESNLQCACREIEEELGISFAPEDLIPIYTGMCYGKDGEDFWVTTYLLNGTFSGIVSDVEDGLLVKPLEFIKLCNENTSPFAHYNQHVISAWRIIRTSHES